MRTLNTSRSVWICGLILCFSCLQSLPAQTVPGRPSLPESAYDSRSWNVIRVSTNLVSVPVSVTDAAGQAIRDLEIEDFRIEEDGVPVAISRVAEASQSPLQIALVFDLSGSVNSCFDFEQQAAVRFLEKAWKPGDLISIVVFSDQPEIRLQSSESLPAALQELRQLQPTRSSTAFFDSVVLAARMLYRSATPETRQATIVLSDGADNRSDCNIVDALREVQRSDILFYSINPSGASVRLNEINLKGQQNLTSLAAETGGTAFVPDKTADLDDVFGRIAAELRTQYLLQYYAPNSPPDGRFRQIKVSISGRPDLRIRARQGYYATPR
jgi:Ca-activated chloride channel family protein